MALHVELKPRETIVLNGAEITNGPQRIRIQIKSGVRLLREKDIMREEECTSPLRKLYFAVQHTYLNNVWRDTASECMALYVEASKGQNAKQADYAALATLLDAQEFYRALKAIQKMIEEDEACFGSRLHTA